MKDTTLMKNLLNLQEDYTLELTEEDKNELQLHKEIFEEDSDKDEDDTNKQTPEEKNSEEVTKEESPENTSEAEDDKDSKDVEETDGKELAVQNNPESQETKTPAFSIDLSEIYAKMQGASTPHDFVMTLKEFFEAIKNSGLTGFSI